MRLTSLIVDDFLDDFDQLQAHATQLSYAGIINPKDNVLYPNISVDVPPEITGETVDKIAHLMAVDYRQIELTIPLCFRLSLAGVKAPHQAHTDLAMGQYNFILYMNDGPLNYGTSVVRHISGMDSQPTNQAEWDLWHQDTNKYDKWEIVTHCPMKANRAFIVPSDLYHRAEPVTGFGTDPTNGRLVLLAFFNIGHS